MKQIEKETWQDRRHAAEWMQSHAARALAS